MNTPRNLRPATLRPLGLATMLAAAIAVAGCQQSSTPDAQQSTPASEASAVGPDAKPGIAASDARLVLPVVAGRPGAAYFTVRNGTDTSVTLASAYIDGVGKTEMHRTQGGKMSPVKTLDIAPGATSTFAAGGLHVMAFDIADNLQAGGETELTLTFADGDKVSLPIKIEAMGAMPAMKH
jgi:copper(I)-binding protein